MRKLLCAFCVLTLALGLASRGWGQSQITAGTVQGDVVDEKGGSVARAIVEAKNLATNFVQTDTTNTDGHFAFLSLAPGPLHPHHQQSWIRHNCSGKCEPYHRADDHFAGDHEGFLGGATNRRH